MQIQAAKLKPLLKLTQHSKSDLMLLDTQEGRIVAVDSDLTIVVSHADLKTGEGKIVVPRQKTVAFLNKLSGEITLTLGSALRITSHRTSAVIESASQNIVVPEVAYAADRTLQLQLPERDRITYVLKAINVDSEETQLGWGLLFDEYRVVNAVNNPGRLAMVAFPTRMFPTRLAMSLSLARTLPLFAGSEVRIRESPGSVRIEGEGLTVIGKRTIPEFPVYNAIIPTSTPFSATMSLAEFKHGLELVGDLIDTSNGLRLRPIKFEMRGGVATLSCKAGSHSFDYTAEAKVDDFECVADCRFLSEFVGALAEETTVRLKGDTGKKPLMFEAGNKTFICVTL